MGQHQPKVCVGGGGGKKGKKAYAKKKMVEKFSILRKRLSIQVRPESSKNINLETHTEIHYMEIFKS